MTAITPHELKTARRQARETRAVYVARRGSALVASVAYRAEPTGRNTLAREDAYAAALEARWVYYAARERLARCEACEVVKGCHVSPAARERLILRGVWKGEPKQ